MCTGRTHQSGPSWWHWVWFQWGWPSHRCWQHNKHSGSCLSSASCTSAPSSVCAARPLDSCQEFLEGQSRNFQHQKDVLIVWVSSMWHELTAWFPCSTSFCNCFTQWQCSWFQDFSLTHIFIPLLTCWDLTRLCASTLRKITVCYTSQQEHIWLLLYFYSSTYMLCWLFIILF